MSTFLYSGQQSLRSAPDLNISKKVFYLHPPVHLTLQDLKPHQTHVLLQQTFHYRLPYQVPHLALSCDAATTTLHHAQTSQRCSDPQFHVASLGFRHRNTPEDLGPGASLLSI